MNLNALLAGFDPVERAVLGKPTDHVSMHGNRFIAFEEAFADEWRGTFIPGHWYAAASNTDGRFMRLSSDGETWWFMTTKRKLAEDLVDIYGSLTRGVEPQPRTKTMQMLMTAYEWEAALEDAAHAAALYER